MQERKLRLKNSEFEVPDDMNNIGSNKENKRP